MSGACFRPGGVRGSFPVGESSLPPVRLKLILIGKQWRPVALFSAVAWSATNDRRNHTRDNYVLFLGNKIGHFSGDCEDDRRLMRCS